LRIENLDRCAIEQRAAGHGIAPRFEWGLLQFLEQLLRKAIMSLGTKIASFIWTDELPDVRLAEPNGRLHQRVEHLLQIEGRAADELEHVSRRRLLLQRLLGLVEQPRVLDRDQRLVAERFRQRDVAFTEMIRPCAGDGEKADALLPAQQRQ